MSSSFPILLTIYSLWAVSGPVVHLCLALFSCGWAALPTASSGFLPEWQVPAGSLTLGVFVCGSERTTQPVLLLNQLRSQLQPLRLLYPTSTIHCPQHWPPSRPSAILGCWQAAAGRVGGWMWGAVRRRAPLCARRKLRPSASMGGGWGDQTWFHKWNCRFDLPSSLVVPPKRPYKVCTLHWGGF